MQMNSYNFPGGVSELAFSDKTVLGFALKDLSTQLCMLPCTHKGVFDECECHYSHSQNLLLVSSVIIEVYNVLKDVLLLS